MARRLPFPSPLSRTALSVLGLSVACSLSACSDPLQGRGPEWIDLSRGFRPSFSNPADRSAWTVQASGRQPIAIQPDRGGRSGFRYRATIERGDWTHLTADVWRAERPLPQDWKRATGSRNAQMRIGGELVAPSRLRGLGKLVRLGNALGALIPGDPLDAALAEALDGIEKPAYCLSASAIYLLTGSGEPADRISFAERVSLGKAEDGVWYLAVAGIYGCGIPVVSGGSEEVEVDVPPSSALRFSTACEPAPEWSDSFDAEVTFRVRLDGETIFESRRPVGTSANTAYHTIHLDEAGRVGARLAFEVSGRARIGAFIGPTIGPADAGRYGDRPWEGDRPDIVLFLADTFRADNLAAYGGDPELTPALNVLAEEGVVFLNARAPSSWTFPSHAAMFSGLYPHQAGTVTRRNTLSTGAWTIAEELRAAGYRTAAVTEGLYASQTFGLAQGFDWFEEHRGSFESTIARARSLIEADDGRPLFLFVHTYRAHHPYRVSEPTRERLHITRSWDDLTLTLDHRDDDWFPGAVPFAASLTDIPHTLAAIAGVGASPAWFGTGLLALEEDRPVFTFQCSNVGGPSDLALVSNGRKLITLSTKAAIRRGDIAMAFDLELDPGEQTDLVDSGAEWPRQLLERLTAEALVLYESVLDGEHAEVSPEQKDHLRALGYLGD